MQADRYFAEADHGSIGPATLILAAFGCFAIGLAALIAIPHIWPRYVQTSQSDSPAQRVPEVMARPATRPTPQYQPAPGVITEIRPGAAPATQKIAGFGVLANLSECKAAIRAGEAYESVGPDQMAAMFGTRGKPLTSAQLDAGCRKLIE
mgnify:CR=1 FL=1